MMQSSSSSWSWWWWCRRWKKMIAVLCTVVGPFYGLVAPLDNNNNSNNESIITVLQWLQRLWKNPERKWRWTQSNNDNSSEIKNSVVVCANERHPKARSFGLPHLQRNFELSAVFFFFFFFFFLRSFSLSAFSLYFGDLVKHFQLRASRASSSFFLDRTTQQKRIIIVIAVTKSSERESELVRRRSMGEWILALAVRASILAGYMNNLLCCKKLQEVLLFLNYCILSLLLLLLLLLFPPRISNGQRGICLLLCELWGTEEWSCSNVCKLSPSSSLRELEDGKLYGMMQEKMASRSLQVW